MYLPWLDVADCSCVWVYAVYTCAEVFVCKASVHAISTFYYKHKQYIIERFFQFKPHKNLLLLPFLNLTAGFIFDRAPGTGLLQLPLWSPAWICRTVDGRNGSAPLPCFMLPLGCFRNALSCAGRAGVPSVGGISIPRPQPCNAPRQCRKCTTGMWRLAFAFHTFSFASHIPLSQTP